MFFSKKEEINTDTEKINELLNRGVDTVYPSKEALEKVLVSGKKLKLYQGFDPTGNTLHIGHMVGLRKHRQWQDLGHEVIFLVGDGTGEAGDPTGKKKTREKFFTSEELRLNAKDYLIQASKIVRFGGPNPIKILYNGDWLNKLTKSDILNIAEHFTVQQLIERDMFQERLKQGEPIHMREFLYPLLQAYDSVEMEVDLELGGSDQTFNMLAGRMLLKAMKHKEKFVMTTPLLSDSKGEKIGKSEGNTIALTDTPDELFGKIMSLTDDAIVPLFTPLTDTPEAEIQSFDIAKNPLELKKRAAQLVITQLYSNEKASQAQENFETTFSKKGIPENVVIIPISDEARIADKLIDMNIVESKTDLRRLVADGAISSVLTGKKVDSLDDLENHDVYKIGKHRFIRVKR